MPKKASLITSSSPKEKQRTSQETKQKAVKSFLLFMLSEKYIFSPSHIVPVTLIESASAALIWTVTASVQ